MVMLVGDVREAMWEDMIRFIEQVINRHTHLDYYYLFVHGKWEGNVLRKTVLVSPKRIPPLLDSFELYIDNRRGDYRLLHCLPADVPLPAELLQGPVVEDIVRSAAKVRDAIVYLD